MNANAIRGGLSPYELFTMVYHKDTGKLCELIKERDLMPMDAAVMLFLVTKVDLITSRISVAPSYIAERLHIPTGTVQASLKRLRAHFVLGKGLKNGIAYYMLNPYFFHTGHTELFPKRAKAFQELFD